MTLNKDYDGIAIEEALTVDGSSVEASLLSSMVDGRPIADDGRSYPTVQQAVNAGSSWAFVPPGTFTENVTIDSNDFNLYGAGYDSIINSDDSEALIINGNNIEVNSLQLYKPNENPTPVVPTIDIDGDEFSIISSTVTHDYGRGIRVSSLPTDAIILNCETNTTVNSSDSINFNGERTIIANNNLEGDAAGNGDDSIIANNIFTNSQNNGIYFAGANDSIAIGNRISSVSNRGILISSTDCIIANNRVSDSGTDDITDNGTSTLLDSNLTGASN